MNRQDYLSIEKSNGVATVWLDQKGEKINKVSPDMVGLFHSVFEELEKDNDVKAVVLISRKKDFIAGADIEMFKRVKKPGDFEPITRKGHEILNRIEKSKKPVVAAIHGNCLGAGLEIALACTARIASDDRSTALALPEVKLGLLPGGGGTQRLPRLIGIQKALDMMLTGKNIYAHPARKMGLVDKLIHRHGLHEAAKKFALELAGKPFQRKDPRKFIDKIIEGPLKFIVFKKARQMVMRMTSGNYPAPFKIIDCVEIGMSKGINAGYDAEAKKFEELVLSSESRQLINVFFAMTEKKKNPLKEKARQIKRLGMLGAGFMGAGIAEVSVNDGIDVVLKDIRQETLSAAKKTIWKNLESRVKKKAMTKIELEETIAKISDQLDYRGFDKLDIVIEAVFEDLAIKHKVLAEVEAVTNDHCIFASNTSALPIKSIAEKAKRPELVIGMHYFSPVPKMPLLEIITYEKTADWVTATCYELGLRQGKTVIVVKDGPGFYTSRILGPFMNEALLLLEEGADILQIDREVRKFGYPVGPVTLFDEVGIDIAAHVMTGDVNKYYRETREGAKSGGAGIVKMHEAGYSGRKNKKGFYQYDPKTGKKLHGKVDPMVYSFFGGPNRKQFEPELIQHRCAFGMINEAAYCLQEGIIATPLDGDVGAIFGLGFPPFRGGPFRYLDTIGADKAVSILEGLAA
ncbi:MAG TPA: 3-hydroxyacyl-CoA dehydrogenase NAD-binding domain-containing protein [Chitinophagales bacterium]|nr:3-hydroxyacyl-CoA dehydrogenase NAD-binding domain-containing protein [Chitinophagales bacterium]